MSALVEQMVSLIKVASEHSTRHVQDLEGEAVHLSTKGPGYFSSNKLVKLSVSFMASNEKPLWPSPSRAWEEQMGGRFFWQ